MGALICCAFEQPRQRIAISAKGRAWTAPIFATHGKRRFSHSAKKGGQAPAIFAEKGRRRGEKFFAGLSAKRKRRGVRFFEDRLRRGVCARSLVKIWIAKNIRQRSGRLLPVRGRAVWEAPGTGAINSAGMQTAWLHNFGMAAMGGFFLPDFAPRSIGKTPEPFGAS